MTGKDLTTPRPWKAVPWLDGPPYACVAIVGDFLVESTASDADPGGDFADAALIVTAVNNYDRLRAIEKAARGPVSDAFATLDALREIARQAGDFHLLSALEPARHAASGLRAALEGAPHE